MHKSETFKNVVFHSCYMFRHVCAILRECIHQMYSWLVYNRLHA
jgi:hypothetical protein